MVSLTVHFLCVNLTEEPDGCGGLLPQFHRACTGEEAENGEPDVTAMVSMVTCMTCKVAIDMLLDHGVSAYCNLGDGDFGDQTVNAKNPADGYPDEYGALVRFGFYKKQPNTEVTDGKAL